MITYLKSSMTGGAVKRFFLFIISLALFGILYPVSHSSAAPVVVTSRAALAGNDFIDWGLFGPTFTTVADPSNINSNNGIITATVSMPSGNYFERRDEGSGWVGNFAPSDRLLWTNLDNGPMVISFDRPVNGAGAQIMADFYGSFTATINVYDASNNLIGSFTVNGDSNGNEDNSAIFLGAMDTSPTIKRIEYSVVSSATPSDDLTINQLDIIDPPTAVPTMTEWGMIIFMALAAAGSIYFLRKKKHARANNA